MSKVAWLGRLFVVVVFIEGGWVGVWGLGPVKSLTLNFLQRTKVNYRNFVSEEIWTQS